MLQGLLNHLLEPAATQQLRPLAGKRLLVKTPAAELAVCLCIGDAGVCATPYHGEAVDASIRGDVLALLALCLGLEDADSLFFSRRLLLSGDTATALMFKNVLANLDVDARRELERMIGRRAAAGIWHAAGKGIDGVAELDRRLAALASGIGQRLGLGSAEAVRGLDTEMQRLGEAQAALQRRMLDLERRLTRASARSSV